MSVPQKTGNFTRWAIGSNSNRLEKTLSVSTASASDRFTDSVYPKNAGGGWLLLALSGTGWVASVGTIVTLQYLDGTWQDEDDFDHPIWLGFEPGVRRQYRLNVKAIDWSGGTLNLAIVGGV